MDFFNNSDEGKMARNLGLSVEDLQEVFDQFDTDGSGGIDSKEFGTLLASLDIVWDDAKIEATVKDIDSDENGLIDFKEFITWFLAGGAGYDSYDYGVKVSYDSMDSVDYGSPEWQALYGDYEWDYDKESDENYAAQEEFHTKQRELQEEERQKDDQRREDAWQKELDDDRKRRESQMFKAKLMMPLYVKKLTKVVEGLTDKPMDACTNSLTVQVGQPEERASVRVFANQNEDWASLNAPANTCSAAVLDFNLRDGYCEESLARVQEIVAAMYAQHVEPMLNKINKLPRGLRETGLFKGKPFDSYRLEVETVNGKEVLRFAVFSGVDTLGGLATLANADMGKLMPSFSAKFTSGFGLNDLLTSGAKLKDMATFKFEVTSSYVKNYILLLTEISIMLRKAYGSVDRWQLKAMKKQSMAVTAFTKFFVAQRSLFYFQFESPFEWARQMVHEFVVPMALEEYEKMSKDMGASLVKEPPSPEVIDAIIDAIGNISGATIGAIKARLLSDRIPIPGLPIKTVFGHIKEQSRLDACKQEAAKEDGDPQAKMLATAWEAFSTFHKVVSGVAQVKGVDQVAEAGVEVVGCDFMEHIPSAEDIENHTQPEEEGMPWMMTLGEQYARKMQGDESAQVDEELIASLLQEFSEVIAVGKAALPLIECANMDFLNEQSHGMASKAEEEAKRLFNSV
jgi:hypothetical protein